MAAGSRLKGDVMKTMLVALSALMIITSPAIAHKKKLTPAEDKARIECNREGLSYLAKGKDWQFVMDWVDSCEFTAWQDGD